MKSLNSFFLRVSGNAGMDDNSIATFMGLYDSFGGDLSLSINGNEQFRKNYPSKKDEIESLSPFLADIFPTKGQVITSDDPEDSNKVVTSLSMVITGRVSFDDNTYGDFSFEVRDDGSIYDHTGQDGHQIWKSLSSDPSSNEIAATLLSSLYSSEDDEITVTIAS